MDVIRQVGFRIASAIHGLHLAGVVHGDIKPRNIVRSQGNEFRVIDLDMSFSVRLPAEGQDRSKTVSYDLASPKRIRNSSAYCCPELFRQVTSSEQNGLASIQEVLQSPYRIDVWSFGVTLFEIATGLALFECQYDRVTSSGEARLLGWQGLDESHVAAIEELYKSSESAALIDLLKWLLDPVAVQRPPDMAGVLAHLFFNPKVGRAAPLSSSLSDPLLTSYILCILRSTAQCVNMPLWITSERFLQTATPDRGLGSVSF